MRVVDYPSSFVHFLCSRETFRQLPSILLVAKRLSVNFRHFCLLPKQLLSTLRVAGHSVNFRQLSVWPEDLLSTFCVAGSTSANFRQFLLWLEIFCELLSACGRETYRLPLTFCAASRRSVTFPCGLETFCQLLSTFVRSGEHS